MHTVYIELWTSYNQKLLFLENSGLANDVQKKSTLTDLAKLIEISEVFAVLSSYQQNKKDAKTNQELLKNYKPNRPHISSPDILIDTVQKQIRMYYHGIVQGSIQKTKVALSSNRLNFKSTIDVLMERYARLFKFQDYYYALTIPGLLY